MIEISSMVGSVELEIYFKQLGLPYRLVPLERLRYGDFAFVGNGPNGKLIRVGIERKTWPDFLASTASNRFNGDQLIGLVESYDDIYLYLEGVSRCNPDTNMFEFQGPDKRWTTGYARPIAWHAVKSMLTSFDHCGIKLEYPANGLDTTRYIGNLYAWYTKKLWEEHNSHQRVKDLKFDVKRPSKVIKFARASGLGHIAATRAEQIFKTVKEMVNTSTYDLVIKGIVSNKAQATKIWNMWN